VKYRVKEDVVVSVGPEGGNQSIKAGTHEETEKNRDALAQLVNLGLAEPVKSSTKEE
jgi:hypothetical protein